VTLKALIFFNIALAICTATMEHTFEPCCFGIYEVRGVKKWKKENCLLKNIDGVEPEDMLGGEQVAAEMTNGVSNC
jgi:hypothetical protein